MTRTLFEYASTIFAANRGLTWLSVVLSEGLSAFLRRFTAGPLVLPLMVTTVLCMVATGFIASSSLLRPIRYVWLS